MTKYKPLIDRLCGHSGEAWCVSFQELEGLLGAPLPTVARTDRSWWTQASRPHVVAWTAKGWVADELNPAAQTVSFRRQQPADATPSANGHVQPLAMKTAAESAARRGRADMVGVAAVAAAVGGMLVGAGLFLAQRLGKRR